MRIHGIIVVNQSHHGSSHEDDTACPAVPLLHPKPYPSSLTLKPPESALELDNGCGGR